MTIEVDRFTFTMQGMEDDEQGEWVAHGAFEHVHAENYALQDQVKGLQELMELPTDWDTLQCKLQEIGLAYWRAHNRERGNGAVKWLQNTETGALFVVTRGEYAQELKDFIFSLDLPAQQRHANTGEVDRLRAELTAQHKRLMAVGMVCDDTLDKYGKLKEQLAERDALLKRQPSFIQFEADDGAFVRLRDVLGALSASAEPKQQIPFVKCEIPSCKSSRGEYTGFCERCERLMWCGASESDLAKSFKVSAEPIAPVERDELTKFKQWASTEGNFDISPCNEKGCRDIFNEFSTQGAWEGWQARAALERKP